MLFGSWTITWFVVAYVVTLALGIGGYVWWELIKPRSTASEEGDRAGSISQPGSE